MIKKLKYRTILRIFHRKEADTFADTTLFPVFFYAMQLVTPSAVAMADSTLMAV